MTGSGKTPRASIAHVPGLDGLRGVAVLGVLLFHARGLLRGGYLGVDLFFVLSGYLITSILLAEHTQAGRIDLRAFWVRRFRRLMPALLALMPAIALYARTIAAPNELASLRADALATIGYVANWRAIFARKSYWEMFTAPSPLEHTWSLAIEEQFYLLWPLLVVGLLTARTRRGRGDVRVVLGGAIVLALASVLAMAALFEEGRTMRVYLGTDTRGAAILIGAALASSGLAAPSHARARLVDVGSVVALGILAVAWWRLDGQSELLYRGGFWLTELAAALVILACVRRPEGPVARLLSLAPLRALGAISYGVYLWHWPVYVVLSEERVPLSPLPLLAVRIAITLAIATVSDRVLERPIRAHGLVRLGPPRLVVPGAVAAVVVLVLATTRAPAVPTVLAALPAPPEPKLASAIPSSPPDAAPKAPVPIGVIPPASELPPGTLRVLVLGDSVALSLGARLHWDQGAANAWADQRAIGDCSILDGIAPVFSMSGEPHGNGNCARNWKSDVEELRPDVAVVILGGAYFSTVRAEGRRRPVCHPGWHDAYAKRLTSLLEEIAPFATRRVVVLAAYPVGKWQTPTLNQSVDCYNRILRDAAEAAHADVIDLNRFVCPNGTCTLTSRGAPVRPDGLHFDGLGAIDTAEWLLARLRELGGSPDGGP